jgi:hypothetical protein
VVYLLVEVVALRMMEHLDLGDLVVEVLVVRESRR